MFFVKVQLAYWSQLYSTATPHLYTLPCVHQRTRAHQRTCDHQRTCKGKEREPDPSCVIYEHKLQVDCRLRVRLGAAELLEENRWRTSAIGRSDLSSKGSPQAGATKAKIKSGHMVGRGQGPSQEPLSPGIHIASAAPPVSSPGRGCLGLRPPPLLAHGPTCLGCIPRACPSKRSFQFPRCLKFSLAF